MITQQAIQERSYSIWESEGRPHGRDLEHWAQAETELRAEVVTTPKRVRAKRAAAPRADTKRSRAAVEAAPLVTH